MIPRAGRTVIAGVRDGRVLVRLSAAPVDGAANDALITFFSTTFDVPRRSLHIVAGEKSRSKRIGVDGLSPDDIRRYLDL